MYMRLPVRSTRTCCKRNKREKETYISKQISMMTISQMCKSLRIDERGTSVGWRPRLRRDAFAQMYVTCTYNYLKYKVLIRKDAIEIYASQYKQLYNNSPFNRWHSLIHSDVLWTCLMAPCLVCFSAKNCQWVFANVTLLQSLSTFE